MDVVEAVEAELDKPGNRGLAGAARSAKIRSEIAARADGPDVGRAEQAIEARERARKARESRDAGLTAWEEFRAEEAAERARENALRIADRVADAMGPFREDNDRRPDVIRQLHSGLDEYRTEAIRHLYGNDVADAYDAGGPDAAIAALPEIW